MVKRIAVVLIAVAGLAGCGSSTPECMKLSCGIDDHCEMVQVECIRAPCPPLATCVPNGAP